jgi:hypothetical protein
VATRQHLSNLLVSKKTKRRFLWLQPKWPLMHRGERTITRSEERRVIVASSVGTVFDVSLAGSKFWNRGEGTSRASQRLKRNHQKGRETYGSI